MAKPDNQFSVKIREVMYRGKNGKRIARMKRVDASFQKRQQARTWCRNHWHGTDHDGMVIVHPDGTPEEFTWDGVL